MESVSDDSTEDNPKANELELESMGSDVTINEQIQDTQTENGHQSDDESSKISFVVSEND